MQTTRGRQTMAMKRKKKGGKRGGKKGGRRG